MTLGVLNSRMGALVLAGACALSSTYLWMYFKNRRESTSDESNESAPQSEGPLSETCLRLNVLVLKLKHLLNSELDLIRRVGERTSTRVTLPSDAARLLNDPDNFTKLCGVLVRGAACKVEAAKAILLEKLQPVVYFERRIQSDSLKHVIGKGGSAIRALRAQTGASVCVVYEKKRPGLGDYVLSSRQLEDMETVFIVGTKEQIDAANASIDRTLSRQRAKLVLPERRSASLAHCKRVSSLESPEIKSLICKVYLRFLCSSVVPNVCHGGERGCVDVTVSHAIGPDLFWVRASEQGYWKQAFEGMNVSMEEEYCRTLGIHAPAPAEEGSLCVVRIKGGAECRRGVVLERRGTDSCLVLLVDYGSVVETDVSNCFEISSFFSDLEFQAVPCGLWNLEPSTEDGVWSDEAVALFRQWTRLGTSAVCRLKVNEKNGPILSVSLFLPSSGELDVSSSLVRSGYAKQRCDVVPNGCSAGDSSSNNVSDVAVVSCTTDKLEVSPCPESVPIPEENNAEIVLSSASEDWFSACDSDSNSDPNLPLGCITKAYEMGEGGQLGLGPVDETANVAPGSASTLPPTCCDQMQENVVNL